MLRGCTPPRTLFHWAGRIPRGNLSTTKDRVLRLGGPTGLGFFLAGASVCSLRPAPSNRRRLTSPLAPSPNTTPPTKPKPATTAAALELMESGPGEERWKKVAVGGDGGLEWELERQFAFEREMLPQAAEPQKPRGRTRRRPFAADLIQNCDLPPPAKLFGPVPTRQRLESAAGTDPKASVADVGDNESLLRALRLSQSRAREAEAKLAAAGAGGGDLAALLVRDSVALSAHRRWVMMLEAENSLLRGTAARGAEPDNNDEEDKEETAARQGAGVAAWWVALAVCIGIAGVGLAVGRFLC